MPLLSMTHLSAVDKHHMYLTCLPSYQLHLRRTSSISVHQSSFMARAYRDFIILRLCSCPESTARSTWSARGARARLEVVGWQWHVTTAAGRDLAEGYLFSFQIISDFDTVALSFLFDKYYSIID